ncbi:hypothetical protein [Ramlibacter sp.]|uniref:hypothetical protein n=1 Tax=Ramlibacter sp. TaxID=1917967 RepID=UPI002B6C2206|nr:hypothetical protein [Ramlibacter sp.]HWI82022.1 hypothetical protein [Ramlibacter sp.]
MNRDHTPEDPAESGGQHQQSGDPARTGSGADAAFRAMVKKRRRDPLPQDPAPPDDGGADPEP